MRLHSYLGSRKVARKSPRQRGSALLELTLLSPWIFFLFVGVVDLGFFSYSLIAVENAARVGAEFSCKSPAAAADVAHVCPRVLNELAMLPNLGGVTSCNAAPLTVSVTSLAGPDGSPATSVSVTYNFSMIPIPGLLAGALNVTRNVQMRVNP